MRALIFGVGGQDGSYLAEALLRRGHDVYGTVRRNSVGYPRVPAGVRVLKADLTDFESVRQAYMDSMPHAVFNEADQDNVDWSIATPQLSVDVTFGAVLKLLDLCKSIKLFQPISATIFGDNPMPTLLSPLDPGSPYAIAKAAVLLACRHYRKLGAHICCPIMFNHDSPRRGAEYLLHRICSGKRIQLSDPGFRVDIGHARDYMELACDLYEHNVDVLVGTGATHSLRELAEIAEADVEWTYTQYRPGQGGAGMLCSTLGLKQLGLEPPSHDIRPLIQELKCKYSTTAT